VYSTSYDLVNSVLLFVSFSSLLLIVFLEKFVVIIKLLGVIQFSVCMLLSVGCENCARFLDKSIHDLIDRAVLQTYKRTLSLPSFIVVFYAFLKCGLKMVLIEFNFLVICM